MLKRLIQLFIRTNGRKPNNLEMILLKQKATKQAVDERKIVSMVDRQPVNPNKPILGGKNVPETEAEIAARLTKQNKETVANINQQMIEEDRAIKDMYRTTGGGTRTLDEDAGYLAEFLADDAGKFLDDLPKAEQTKFYDRAYKALVRHQKKKLDPEDFASGGIAGMLGEPTYADDNHRVPYKDGSKMSRRGFLKILGGLATIPLVGKYFKWAKPLAKSSKVLTSVPIKNIDGMPLWFKPLVNKVIKEGKEIESAAERVIVHKAKLPNSKTDIYVSQDLSTGGVEIQIGAGKHGFPDGHLGQPVRLEYRASEMIEPDVRTWGRTEKIPTGKVFTGKESMSGAPKKTKEEFWVEEAEFTGGHPENIKFEESSFEKFGEHGSNFDEVEMFATGKVKKKKPLKKSGWGDEGDHNPDLDMASGGRVPMWLGGGLSAGKRTLSELLKYMSKGSSHGKTPSEMLYMINPKQFNQMLDRPEGIPSIAKEMIEKYTKEMKIDRARMIEDLIGTGRKIKKVDDNLVNLKIKIIEDMVSKGVDRKIAKEMADNIAEMASSAARKKATPKITDRGLLEMENIQKNLATKDRKLNASGGLAGMLGE